MAVSNPQTRITLPENVHQTILRLAELTEQPRARLITALLCEAHPSLQELVEALEKARHHDKEAVRLMHSLLVNAQKTVLETQLDLINRPSRDRKHD